MILKNLIFTLQTRTQPLLIRTRLIFKKPYFLYLVAFKSPIHIKYQIPIDQSCPLNWLHIQLATSHLAFYSTLSGFISLIGVHIECNNSSLSWIEHRTSLISWRRVSRIIILSYTSEKHNLRLCYMQSTPQTPYHPDEFQSKAMQIFSPKLSTNATPIQQTPG